MKTQIDHLVVVAHTLEQGVQWCKDKMGVTPGPGGEHERFGTHNRLFKIATPENPFAYFEIIATNPAAKVPSCARWFDMDDPSLQKAVATEPKLVHFVANTSDIQAARQVLFSLGVDRGPAVQASRHSRKGFLQWQITVRNDGQRLFNGALPTLIQWGKPDDEDPMRLHPRNSLPRSGVSLSGITISHPSTDKLQAAYEALGLTGIAIGMGPANITATLRTPKGIIELRSLGLT
jgi:hypothetical protein